MIMHVALHPEGVDRNSKLWRDIVWKTIVALHPEGVDRNYAPYFKLYISYVALHPEGVDRNPPIS